MPSFNALKISKPAFLQTLRWEDLRMLLAPFSNYFTSRGLDIESLGQTDENAFSALGDILTSPDVDTPNALTETLFIISQMARADQLEALLDDANELEVSIGAEDSIEQIAIKLWLKDRERLKQRHSEIFMTRARAFEYFSSESEAGPAFRPPTITVLQQLERSLDVWFEKRKRGKGCRVRFYQKRQEVWFLICHGDLFQRVGTWENGKSGTLGYRPDKYDVVVFDQLTNELRINAGTAPLRDQYRKQFGFHLFGRENHFPGTSKYSLEALREHGPMSLLCDDVGGINWVKLSKLAYELPEHERLKRTESSDDVFAAMAQRGFRIPANARLLSATFTIRFRDNPRPRSVIIKPANVALYTRDDDSQCVEAWLIRRGFIENGKVKGHEQAECILEIA